MNYILVVEDEEDIRDLIEMGISAHFPLEVITAASGNKALDTIQKKGIPEAIVSDYKMSDGDGAYLWQSLQKMELNVPFIVCSGNPANQLQSLFPNVKHFVEKPRILDPLLKILTDILSTAHQPTFVPIRLSMLLRTGVVQFDLYMRLSDQRYVKVINGGDSFLEEDFNRFDKKSISYLHITSHEADRFLKSFEENLSIVMSASDKMPGKELVSLSLDSLETIERMAHSLGWTPEILEAAKKSISIAIKALSKEPKIFSILKERLSDKNSKFGRHITLQTMMSCLFCHNLGWVSEGTQMKLAMAALLHDLTVDESHYENIEEWNLKAADSEEKSMEVLVYRNHPVDSANIAQNLKALPPDVDQIILQHHENQFGTGFPRKLSPNWIGPLSALFIITEDLIYHINRSTELEPAVLEFMNDGQRNYTSGNFKKIFTNLSDQLAALLQEG